MSKTSTPQKGCLAFVQFDSDVNIDHTALVYDVDDTYVYTIEGNRSNKVDKKKYYKSTGKQVNYSSTYIEFYGNPSYNNTSPSTPEEPVTPKITISTNSVTNLKTTSVTVSGSYYNPNSKQVTAIGVYYGKDASSMKRYAVDRDESYVNGGIYYDLVSLSPGTTYYYQLFANNGSTDFKGEINTFQTIADASNIEVTTSSFQKVDDTTVRVNASYYNPKSVTVKKYGFYYGTDTNTCIFFTC